MCEMASSCLCVDALTMASGSCRGKGNTSLQIKEKEKFKFEDMWDQKVKTRYSQFYYMQGSLWTAKNYGNKTGFKNQWALRCRRRFRTQRAKTLLPFKCKGIREDLPLLLRNKIWAFGHPYHSKYWAEVRTLHRPVRLNVSKKNDRDLLSVIMLLPADTVEGHQSTQVREAECWALQGERWLYTDRVWLTANGSSGTLVQL